VRGARPSLRRWPASRQARRFGRGQQGAAGGSDAAATFFLEPLPLRKDCQLSALSFCFLSISANLKGTRDWGRVGVGRLGTGHQGDVTEQTGAGAPGKGGEGGEGGGGGAQGAAAPQKAAAARAATAAAAGRTSSWT
jgi:hypothetical protein